MSFTLNTGPSTSSSNMFQLGLLDESITTIARFTYDPSTGELYSGVYLTSGGTTSLKSYYLGDNNTALILAENTTVDLSLYFDKTTGLVALQGVNGSTILFTKTYIGAKINIDPNYVSFVSSTSASNSASHTIFVDDILVKARPCLLYDTEDNATFSYSESTLCNTAPNLEPTKVDGSVTGMFTSTPAGLSLNATTGLLTSTTSSPGTYTIQFASDIDNTCDDSTTVSITIEDCAGLPEHLSSAFSVAPNPAKDFFTVTLSDNISSNDGLIRFMTSEGKEVESRMVSSNNEEVFNVSNLEAGIYFIQLECKIEKVVVQ